MYTYNHINKIIIRALFLHSKECTSLHGKECTLFTDYQLDCFKVYSNPDVISSNRYSPANSLTKPLAFLQHIISYRYISTILVPHSFSLDDLLYC